MLLVGRYLSPFTRRTAIVLKTLNIDFEVKTLPATPENAELVAINPLGRVPAVVLDDGEVLIDSAAIIDHLLEVGDPDNTLLAAGGADRAAGCGVGCRRRGSVGAYPHKHARAQGAARRDRGSGRAVEARNQLDLANRPGFAAYPPRRARSFGSTLGQLHAGLAADRQSGLGPFRLGAAFGARHHGAGRRFAEAIAVGLFVIAHLGAAKIAFRLRQSGGGDESGGDDTHSSATVGARARDDSSASAADGAEHSGSMIFAWILSARPSSCSRSKSVHAEDRACCPSRRPAAATSGLVAITRAWSRSTTPRSTASRSTATA